MPPSCCAARGVRCCTASTAPPWRTRGRRSRSPIGSGRWSPPTRLAGAWPGAPALPLRGSVHGHAGRDPRSLPARRDLARGPEDDPSAAARAPRFRRGLARRRSARWWSSTTAIRRQRSAPTYGSRWPQERDLEALSAPACTGAAGRRGPASSDELAGLLERIDAVPHVAFVHGPGLTPARVASGARSRCTSSCASCATAATWSRWHCPRPPGPGAPRTCWPGRPGTAGTWISPAVIRSWSRPRSRSRRPRGSTWRYASRAAPGGLPAGVTSIALCSLPVPGVEVSIRTAAAGVQAAGTGAPPGRRPA